MGEVWRGLATFSDGHAEEVAIKRVQPWLSDSPRHRTMLEDEARLGMLLRHDNIVRVYDARMQGSFIIVMEYVRGMSLAHVVQALSAPMPVAMALHIARELASALTHAHEAVDEAGRSLEIIHGDISPHNVLVSTEGDVKLMDFGLARTTANVMHRDPRHTTGKPGYMAPEVVAHRHWSQAVDLFAVGVVLWECLSGLRLFRGATPQASMALARRCQIPALGRDDVTERLSSLLYRLLAKRPEDRPASARALGLELDRILSLMDHGIGRLGASAIVHRIQADQRRQRYVPKHSIPVLRPDVDSDDAITTQHRSLA